MDFSDIEAQLKKAVAFAQTCGELRRDTEARELWREVYHELSAAKPGLFGAVSSRAEAYAVRPSLVYAVLDCSEFIRREHLQASLAAWRYCEDSARYIFGDSLGDPDADAILAALREAGPAGLTRTEINERVFNRNHSETEIDRALNFLVGLRDLGVSTNSVLGHWPVLTIFADPCSASQIMSKLPSCRRFAGVNIGGMSLVRLSVQRCISTWPSAKETPPAMSW